METALIKVKYYNSSVCALEVEFFGENRGTHYDKTSLLLDPVFKELVDRECAIEDFNCEGAAVWRRFKAQKSLYSLLRVIKHEWRSWRMISKFVDDRLKYEKTLDLGQRLDMYKYYLTKEGFVLDSRQSVGANQESLLFKRFTKKLNSV